MVGISELCITPTETFLLSGFNFQFLNGVTFLKCNFVKVEKQNAAETGQIDFLYSLPMGQRTYGHIDNNWHGRVQISNFMSFPI